LALAAGAAALSGLSTRALAEDFEFGQLEMGERYDSAARAIQMPKSSVPTLSPFTVQATENAIAQYQQIAAQGGWQPLPAGGRLRLGMQAPEVLALRRRLIVTGDLAPSLGNSDIFDSYVEGGVRRFQSRHGIMATGVVGETTRAAMDISIDIRLQQLSNNIVRLRSMSGDLGKRYVMMNIPATEVEAVENGVVEQRHASIVGKPDRASPILSARILNINFNPFWTVPASIIKKDLVPKMLADPTYLTRHNIRIFTPTGAEMQPEQVDWNSEEPLSLRFTQDPGSGNSMGAVRINIANEHGVYMHDTPAKSLFGQDYRFHSSGCARIQNVRDLCAWILRGTEYSREKIDEVIRSGERVDAKPVSVLPIYWVYVTAWATPEGVVQFRDDIYDKDGFASLSVIKKEQG
jgi:murein L,D-transpeptidase YcbB/YkuD